jgi:cytochrome c oxidase subunit II
MKRNYFFKLLLCFLMAGSFSPLSIAATDQAAEMTSQNQEEKKQDLELSGTIINDRRVIEVQASRYKYTPDPIVVKKGEKIQIIATTADVTHGFAIRDLHVNAIINPGKSKKINFFAYKTGEFPIYCSVYCGEGHKSMTGKFIVIE